MVCTRLLLVACAIATSGCSMTLPFGGMATAPEPQPVVLTTASLKPPGPRGPDAALTDLLGPEDIRRAHGAMAIALDPQGNGQPASWDNAESRSSGRFTPVGGPFLREFEVCRAFLAHVRTLMDQRSFQGAACRPSGGEWSITDLKPWRQPG